MNKNERMNALNRAGINTGKYFNIELPNGLKAGSTISVKINENGEPVVMTPPTNDVIANQIIEDGYVRNTKLHRRFVMAQMFQMLGYTSWDGKETGFDAALRHYGYDYQFKMMLEEVRVLSKLEARDYETFRERVSFFSKEVITKTCNDYVIKLGDYIANTKTYNCKGVPYKKVRGVNIFCEDLNKKVYSKFDDLIYRMMRSHNYAEMYKLLGEFNRNMIRISYNTPKCKEWVDAYKGEGAFYTLKNLIMFHDCGIVVEPFNFVVRGEDAMRELNMRLKDYQGEGWRMFAFMKKVIKDNNFNFDREMSKIYNK